MSTQPGSERSGSFIEDGLRLVFNQCTIMLSGLAGGVVLARTLGPEGRGLIAAVTAYPTAFLSLAELGVRQASIFYLGRKLLSDRQVVAAITALVLISGVGGALLCSGALAATRNPAFTPVIIALAVGVVPLTLVTSYSVGVFLGKRLVVQMVRIERMAALLRLILIVLLVWWSALGVAGALTASLLAALWVAIFAARRVSQIAPLRPGFDAQVVGALLKKGILYSVALFADAMLFRADILLMERLNTLEQIGLYTTGTTVSQLFWILPNALNSGLFSYSATAASQAAFTDRVTALFRVLIVFSTVAMGTMVLLAPVLIPLVYGPKFAPAAGVVLLLAPGSIAYVCVRVLVIDMAGRGRPLLYMGATVPALALSVTLNALLLRRYGAIGAAAVASLSQCLMATIYAVLYCRGSGLSLGSLLRFRSTDVALVVRLWQTFSRKVGLHPTPRAGLIG